MCVCVCMCVYVCMCVCTMHELYKILVTRILKLNTIIY